MKNSVLRFGVFTALMGFSFFLFSSATFTGSGSKETKWKDAGRSLNLNWSTLGPDNVAGRIRAILFDSRDASGFTVYAGGVYGGLFKSTNLGLTWNEVPVPNGEVLKISCITQAPDGKIYLGTGETFAVQDFSLLKDYRYTSGFMGSGIYSSTDGISFSVLPSTVPTQNAVASEFAFINELAVDPRNGRLFAATNTGLKYTDDGNTWNTALPGLSHDVKVSSDGTVLSSVNNSCYIARAGDVGNFVNLSDGSETGLPLASGVSRAEFAIAPSDPNVLYASLANPAGSLLNIYVSDNKGLTWAVVFPGNNLTYEPFDKQGIYNNTIVVFPDNPHKVLLGGKNMWVGQKYQPTGYYGWEQASFPTDPDSPFYLHLAHHCYLFNPVDPNYLGIGTDGGFSLGTLTSQGISFQERNKNLRISLYHSVGYSNAKYEAIGGLQGKGVQYIDGNQNTYHGARQVWDAAGGGTYDGNGGYAAVSLINPNAVYYSKGGGEYRSSEDGGITFSMKFPGDSITNDLNFIGPIYLWESFNYLNSRDSLKYIARDSTINAGENILMRSDNNKFPFYFTMPVALQQGDSIMVQDIVQSRIFIASKKTSRTYGIYMSKEALKFTRDMMWYQVASIPDSAVVTCITVSRDLNYLYAGTKNGLLYRISNLALAYNYNTADILSANCIVDYEVVKKFNGRSVTSISFANDDNNQVIVTLGNYGNNDYVFLSLNALDSVPTFSSVQGNLPRMPVYSSLVEVHDKNRVIIGTEMGVYSTPNIRARAIEWSSDFAGMGTVPVMMLSQQKVFQPSITVGNFSFPGIHNYGSIYAATYGKGLFIDETYYEMLDVPSSGGSTLPAGEILIYPNPVKGPATIQFSTATAGNVFILVHDLTGKVVKNQTAGTYPAGVHTVSVDMSNLPAGTFVVEVRTESGSAYSKFVKTR